MVKGEHRERLSPKPYVERLGVSVDEYLDILQQPPERPLTEGERQQFFSIDDGLLRGEYVTEHGKRHEVGDVEGWQDGPPDQLNFIPDSFASPEGLVRLAEIEGTFNVAASVEDSLETRLARLATLANGDETKGKQLKAAAVWSRNEQRDKLVDATLKGDHLDDPAHLYLYADPKKLIKVNNDVRRLQELMRTVSRDVVARTDISATVHDALQVEVSILRQRLTGLRGELNPALLELRTQAELAQDEALQTLVYQAAPELMSFGPPENVNSQFTYTMDRWRNGVVRTAEDTSLSPQIKEMVATLMSELREGQFTGEGVFTPEEIAYLDSLEFGGEQIAAMMRHFLQRNNLLSSASSDDYVENEWPVDHTNSNPKIGICVADFVSSLSYSNGWLKVPKNAPSRKLRQTAPQGPGFVVPHEEEHAIDGITMKIFPQTTAAKAKARGASGIREGIGKQAEKRSAAHLFGQSLQQSTSYAAAMEAYEATGSENDAILAGARQKAYESNEPLDKKHIRNAAIQVQRLIRYGFNSSALQYVEQEIIARRLDSLPSELRDTIAANSYLDLASQAALHSFGLLNEQRYQPEVTPIKALEEYLRQQLQQRKQTQ